VAAAAPTPAIGPDGEIDWQVAAAAAGMPSKLLQRSVEAKATASGRPAAEVLSEMIGSPPATPAPAAAPVDVPTAAAPAPTPPTATPAAAATEGAAAPSPQPAPQPAPERFESEEEAAAAAAIPRWLAAGFVLIPTIAVLYALFLPNGPNCGDAGSLAVDPVSGVAVNCDATPYGVETVDFYAIGRAEFTACAACHGDNGGGAGNFPAFVGGALLETFPEGQCQAQVDWVSLGSTGWPEATYGATGKPVGGSGAVMPAFGATLTEEQVRAVVLYERVRFGGEDLDTALADCGLTDPAASQG
jgi:mono/diheme cytochrome c family protein